MGGGLATSSPGNSVTISAPANSNTWAFLVNGDGPGTGLGSSAIGMKNSSGFPDVSDRCEKPECRFFLYVEDGKVRVSVLR